MPPRMSTRPFLELLVPFLSAIEEELPRQFDDYIRVDPESNRLVPIINLQGQGDPPQEVTMSWWERSLSIADEHVEEIDALLDALPLTTPTLPLPPPLLSIMHDRQRRYFVQFASFWIAACRHESVFDQLLRNLQVIVGILLIDELICRDPTFDRCIGLKNAGLLDGVIGPVFAQILHIAVLLDKVLELNIERGANT